MKWRIVMVAIVHIAPAISRALRFSQAARARGEYDRLSEVLGSNELRRNNLRGKTWKLDGLADPKAIVKAWLRNKSISS
ncbi:MAG: hypothetical protein ACREBU_00860 [Nitrososphaera sp.]